MSARDDLERVGAEAICARRGHTGPFRKCPTSQMDTRAVLDAVLASRDADGNRMVILASELKQVGWMNEYNKLVHLFVPYEDEPIPPHYEPVFVFRPPSGEPT